MRESEAKGDGTSGSGLRKVAAVIIKKLKDDKESSKQDEEIPKSDGKKGKGKGKSSNKTRTAADIRDQSTAEDEKKKRKDKKSVEEEEDPDLPTEEEIAASNPASKNIIIH